MPTPLDIMGGIITAGITNDINNDIQLNQQGKLNEQQLEMNARMNDMNYANQMRLWNATGYEAQVRQMKKANLNPNILMSKGGTGGTVAAATTSNNAPQAPKGMELMTSLQASQLAAQIELTKAQTNKTNAETTKTSGVDTTLGQTQIASLTQGIKNQEAVEQLTKADTYLRNIQGEIAGRTKEDTIQMVEQNLEMLMNHVRIAYNEEEISSATIQDKIKLIRETAIGAVLKNELTTAQTAESQAGAELKAQQIAKYIAENSMTNDKGETKTIDQIQLEIEKEFKTDLIKVGYANAVGNAIGNIINLTKLRPKKTTTTKSGNRDKATGNYYEEITTE